MKRLCKIKIFSLSQLNSNVFNFDFKIDGSINKSNEFVQKMLAKHFLNIISRFLRLSLVKNILNFLIDGKHRLSKVFSRQVNITRISMIK